MAETKELRTSPRIDCFSRSMYDDDVDCGLVIDISETGVGLTVSKDTPLFKDIDTEKPASSYGCLRLNIFHPDHPSENSLSIDADIAWLDPEYSKHRLKLGARFSAMDDSKASSVNSFIDWIEQEENYFLRCDLEKC